MKVSKMKVPKEFKPITVKIVDFQTKRQTERKRVDKERLSEAINYSLNFRKSSFLVLFL